jgi:hypothetical protein
MNTLSDPRRAAYFDQNLGAGIYEGGPYVKTIFFILHSREWYRDRSSIFLDYAEVNFYLADAAERSISGTLLQLDSTIKVSQLHSTIGDFLMLKLLLT